MLSFTPIASASISSGKVLGSLLSDIFPQSAKYQQSLSRGRKRISFQGFMKFVQTSCQISVPGVPVSGQAEKPMKFMRDKKVVPEADPPSNEDVIWLYQFLCQSSKLVVLTGAGMSTECGIPDYRSPNGAYSAGFKPITHQEFLHSSRARKRYWARSYAGWRQFTSAQPSSAHIALASLEKAGRIRFMITQNVDRLHHRAGSNPLELHGTVYSVICLDCGFSFCRNLFQDEVKALNPKVSSCKICYPPEDYH
ncbi:hypothetical protein SLEP1_g22262 [Rubroshorea leprosula]|uniref:Deacetylase sirtuin-type domain-containing protein n=1 Tax=Rubroshorea leprosula TaxID=152421 RepID=A0AAV5J8M5_9ROSI|nr:hypothetical protein SLEP1_g22262 [Rubroshorea leprosula]